MDFDLPEKLCFYEGKSKEGIKRMVDKASKKFALTKFNNMKSSHSKLQKVHYDVIQLQNYLKLKEHTVDESKMLLLWRLRMTKFAAKIMETRIQCVHFAQNTRIIKRKHLNVRK